MIFFLIIVSIILKKNDYPSKTLDIQTYCLYGAASPYTHRGKAFPRIWGT